MKPYKRITLKLISAPFLFAAIPFGFFWQAWVGGWEFGRQILLDVPDEPKE